MNAGLIPHALIILGLVSAAAAVAMLANAARHAAHYERCRDKCERHARIGRD